MGVLSRALSRRPPNGRRGHAGRARFRPMTLTGPLALCPSPSSSHHHSRMPSLTPSIAVCALPRRLPSSCRCRPSISAAVSFPSAVPFPSAVSATAVSPRPFPLTYHIAVVPRTSLAHVASALIFCLNLAQTTSQCSSVGAVAWLLGLPLRSSLLSSWFWHFLPWPALLPQRVCPAGSSVRALLPRPAML
jgi:hypothetical protein